MSVWGLTMMICLVAVTGTVGGAATRYERYGPTHQRGPAGALAVICLTLAVTVALTVFGVATVQTDGIAWRLLGVACAGGVFGGLVAARGVDHFLVLRSQRQALAAVAEDARSILRRLRESLGRLPWRQITDAMSGVRSGLPRDRSRD
ncbi:MAG: hypothetical protein H0V10_01730 [Geodermatophilaceae bacterium]|nr:hypothetical protein [Geodermatophilaceae bacterium]